MTISSHHVWCECCRGTLAYLTVQMTLYVQTQASQMTRYPLFSSRREPPPTGLIYCSNLPATHQCQSLDNTCWR
ncbi:hypothetical protein OF83DRAFT_1143335 [Amylostereum chailletii]|nr:hypothetical protein OF83DRAFT_1143335 [Amylostereum chailletii]